MTDEEVISWIFLSIALASEKEPTDYKGISMIADGINHAVPNHKEIQDSIAWLTKYGLVDKQGKKYKLSAKGNNEFEKATKRTKTLQKVWKKLEKNIINFAQQRL